jgi:hypothetical protein
MAFGQLPNHPVHPVTIFRSEITGTIDTFVHPLRCKVERPDLSGCAPPTDPSAISFRDDQDPKYMGLQAADYIAAIYRQAAYDKSESGEKRNPRIIDVILFRNLDDPRLQGLNLSFMPEPAFELMTEAFRIDERNHKRQWKAQGITGRKYYPLDYADSIKAVCDKIAPAKRGEFIKWMRNSRSK